MSNRIQRRSWASPKFFIVLLFLCCILTTLKAHNFHQVRINIEDKNKKLNWELTLPFPDLVEFIDIDANTRIDADPKKNWDLVLASRKKIESWLSKSLLYRQLPAHFNQHLFFDPEYEKRKPKFKLPNFESKDDEENEEKPPPPPSKWQFPGHPINFQNLKLVAHYENYDKKYTIIDKVSLHFTTPKEIDTKKIVFSQHFLEDYFDKKIECTINFKNIKGEFHPPLMLTSGYIVNLDVSKPLSRFESARNFCWQGFTHILEGYDHLAFLLGLILIHLTKRSLLISVTLFTLAHCLTLLLSGTDTFSLPPSIVEPLIALTVAASGFHAFKKTGQLIKEKKETSGKFWYLVVFVFGLIHGLGFSFLLKDSLPENEGILLWLFSFNLGIELGQIVFLAFLFVIFVFLAKTKHFYWFFRYFLSALLLFAGTFWFVRSLNWV